MLLAILDTETTGLDPLADEVIEVGGVLYETDYQETIQQFSTLMPVSSNNAESHNRLNAEVSKNFSADLTYLKNFLEVSTYVVGHNFKNFDEKFFGKDSLPKIDKPVLDTLTDFTFPRAKSKSRKLTDIAIDHCIPVWCPHRALYDCQLIVSIYNSYSKEELAELITKALEPKYLYISTERYPGTLSKEAGFTWKDPVEGKWAKWMREEDAEKLPFNVVRIG